MDIDYFIFKDGRKVHSSVFHKLAKDLPVYDFIITEDLLDKKLYWKNNTVWDMMVHFNKVSNADLLYPIILNSEGLIIDGWHRIVRALLEDRKTIKAVQLTKALEERINYGSKI